MKEDRAMTALGVVTAVAGLLAMSTGRWIIGGIILLLAFGIFWNRGGGKFNDRSIYEKVVKTDLSISDIYEKVKDIDTPLGRAWIGQHKGFEGDSIIFGPNAFKDCVIISRTAKLIDIKHITLLDNIIRKEEDEYRFRDFVNADGAEVTPEKYAIFVSFKIASVMLIKHLLEIVEDMADGIEPRIPSDLDIFSFYYHNSSEGCFRDKDGNDLLKVESTYSPFTARVLDADGAEEMASVVPRSYNGKGVVTDSDVYDMFADGEHFGTITRERRNGGDCFVANTDAGTFDIDIFPAVRRANVSCNYTIKQGGKLKAVIGGSPNILFGTTRCQNDVILSYDDDLFVLYAAIEIFIMTINKKFLK